MLNIDENMGSVEKMSENSHPLVSIIIPCWNAESTIAQAVSSVKHNNEKNIEILICDDASTDNSVRIIRRLMRDDTRIRLLQNKKNEGAGFCRRVLLETARGKFFAFLDSDDFWLPGKLDKQLEVANNGHDIVTCAYVIINEDGKEISRRIPPKTVNYFSLLLSNWIPMSMTLVNADLLYSRSMPHIRKRQDYAYWLQLFRHNGNIRFISINNPLGIYTRREMSVSSSKWSNLKYNYKMFHEEQNFGVLASIFATLCNSIVRMFRS